MNHPDRDHFETAAPLFGTWRRAYWATFAVFALEVALLYAFTRFFALS